MQSILKAITLFLVLSLWIAPKVYATSSTYEGETTELVLATPLGEGQFTHYLFKVFKALGAKVNINFTIQEVPKKRALVATNHGQYYDGVTARIRDWKKKASQICLSSIVQS